MVILGLVDSVLLIFILSKWGILEVFRFYFSGTEKCLVSRKDGPYGSFIDKIESTSGKVGKGRRKASPPLLIPILTPILIPSSVATILSLSICINLNNRFLNSCEIFPISMVCCDLGAIKTACARYPLKSASPSVNSHLSSSMQMLK